MHNETLEHPFTFRTMEAGEDQKLEFLLYKESVKEVYRSLHLRVLFNKANERRGDELMTIFYLDTSALVKRYKTEEGSDIIDNLYMGIKDVVVKEDVYKKYSNEG